MTGLVRVLIADDHTLFREGLTAILTAADDTEVVGEAADGLQAVEQAAAVPADVILMDIMMPKLNGIEATRRILQANPEAAIIVLTMLEDDDSLFAAMRAGARGYILKGADKDEVLKTIRAAARGEALFGPAVAKRLTHFFRNSQTPYGNTAANEQFPELTKREFELLEFIAQGCSNPEIAHKLTISPKTVSNHISNIFSKLQVADRAHAIVKARQAGLGQEQGKDLI